MNLQERNRLADNFTPEVLVELMKQVPDVLAKIIAEKYRINRISSIATGKLTFNNSWVILSILSGV